MAEKRSEEGKRRKNQYASQYSMEHYERINTTMPIGTKERFKNVADKLGLSVSMLMLKSVEYYCSQNNIDME